MFCVQGGSDVCKRECCLQHGSFLCRRICVRTKCYVQGRHDFGTDDVLLARRKSSEQR